MKKHRYKLATGLSEVIKTPFFKSDKEAWESLRKRLPHRFATLYREEIILDLPIVNRKEFIRRYNAKYATKIIGKECRNYWVPVLWGITAHSYRGVRTFSADATYSPAK